MSTIIKNSVLMLFLLASNILFGQGWSEMVKLNSSGYDPDARFGTSVAISGEYAIIGAPKSDKNNTNAGAAFIYFLKDGEWNLVQTIQGSDTKSFDLFGQAVAIDKNYIVVGAYAHDYKNTNSGAAYIFKNQNGIWTELKKLTASDPGENDNFAYSVAISGDNILIGANGKDANGIDIGTAYIYKNSGDTWLETAKLYASDKTEKDLFGYSVSIAGDYALIGAYKNDDKGADCGSAYFFKNTADIWTEVLKVVPADLVQDDRFGFSVSISPSNAIIGSPGRDLINAQDIGKAYFYKNISGVWTQVSETGQEKPAAYNNFGGAVSISEKSAVVSSYYDDERGDDSGAAFFYSYESDSWIFKNKITASDASVDDKFGWAVSLIDDYGIIGAYGNDDTGEDAGASYIYTSKLAISFHPKDTTICSGSSFIFSIKATGAESYQWEVDSTGTFIPLTDNSVYLNTETHALTIFKTTEKMDGFKFRCTITGKGQTQTSKAAVLSTLDNISPEITCVDDFFIDKIKDTEQYSITTKEFDPEEVSDNCGILSITNNITGTNTLNGAKLPVGTTNVVWTVTDKAGNTSICSHNINYGVSNGIENRNENNIQIHPNPAKDRIFISNVKEESFYVKICDISGKIVYLSNLSKKNNQILLKDIKKGIYFIEISTQKLNIKQKLIIE